ncbi:BTAD domain-containing putative transcriptional regulator [Microbacteriaceae bacterium 4G12]
MTPTRQGQWDLDLLGHWELRLGGELVEVAPRQQRIVAALALLGTRPRGVLAELLWPGTPESKAAGNLRTGMWKITHDLPGLLCASHDSLALAPRVSVDWQRMQERMSAIESPTTAPDPADIAFLENAVLLPGWYDDWVISEQERSNARRLRALESLATKFLAAGDGTRCAEAAGVAASIEPLRESPVQLIVQGHISTGNYYPALRAFEDFRALLTDELAVEPSPRLQHLIAEITVGR